MNLKQTKRQANQLFRFCLVEGALDEGRAHLVVDKILNERRRGYLTLLRQFIRLLSLDHARHTAQVESAVPLGSDLRAQIEEHIHRVYGTRVQAFFEQNAALIGGMRVKIGSDVYDGSIRYGLVSLEKSFGIANGSKAMA